MITLPLSRPEQRSEGAPAATIPGSSGESPGNAESIAAASAFLPVLMQVLVAPQTQVVFPAPNREESAPMQGGIDACGSIPLQGQVPDGPSTGLLVPAKPAAADPVSALPQPVPVNDQMAVHENSDKAPTAKEQAGPAPRMELPRFNGPVHPESPGIAMSLKEFTSFQNDPPLRVNNGRQGSTPADVRQPDPTRTRRELSGGEQRGAAVQVSFQRSSGGQSADVPRLMADLIAATGRTPGHEFFQEPSAPPEGPAPAGLNPLKDGKPSPGAEAAPAAKVVQPTAHKELKQAMIVKRGERPEQEPSVPGEDISPAGSMTDRTDAGPEKTVSSGQQKAPEMTTDSGDRDPAPAQKQPAAARSEGERARAESGDGQAKEPVHTIVPVMQPGRMTEMMRARPLDRAPGVQGLPRELVSSVLQRVVRELVITGAKGGTEARLTLKPDSLGELLVHISMEENVMSARIDVTQPAAKAVLDAGMPHLREALSLRGIAVHNIDVFTSTDSMPRNTRDQRDGRPKNGALRQEAGSAADPVILPRMLGYNTIELSM